jgi:hypothetical protein
MPRALEDISGSGLVDFLPGSLLPIHFFPYANLCLPLYPCRFG